MTYTYLLLLLPTAPALTGIMLIFLILICNTPTLYYFLLMYEVAVIIII
jgi:hypothetical protein